MDIKHFPSWIVLSSLLKCLSGIDNSFVHCQDSLSSKEGHTFLKKRKRIFSSGGDIQLIVTLLCSNSLLPRQNMLNAYSFSMINLTKLWWVNKRCVKKKKCFHISGCLESTIAMKFFSRFFNTITSLVLASVYFPVNSTLLPSDKVESYRSLLSDFGISCILRNHRMQSQSG